MKLGGSVRCVLHPILQRQTAGYHSFVHTVRSGKETKTHRKKVNVNMIQAKIEKKGKKKKKNEQTQGSVTAVNNV